MNKKIFKYLIVFLAYVSYINLVVADDAPVPKKLGVVDDFDEAFSTLKNPFVSPVVVKMVVPVVVKKKEEPVKPKEVVAQPVEAPVIINPPVLKITGLVWNSKKPQAIINGMIVAVGEVVDGSTLVAVRKSEIDVMYKGQQFTISSQAKPVVKK